MAIYLDWNATTPLAPEVRAAMHAAMENAWGNPASVHGAGRDARREVEDARGEVSKLLGRDPRDVLLTGGGTEANNLALSLPTSGETVLVSRTEHPSVVKTVEAAARRGVLVHFIEPTSSGHVDLEALGRALAAGSVRLVSVMAVNHETGVIQPVAEVADLATRAGALFHCDAVQAIGRVSVDLLTRPDLVSIASHKIRGPKGIGALALKPGVDVRALAFGGAQERGVRPGTQDPVAAAGFAAALRRVSGSAEVYGRLGELRDKLERALLALGGVSNVSGLRAPHLANVSFEGWLGPELCAALDLEGIHVSSGSACSAGTAEPSPVLTAVVGRLRAAGAVRVSLGEGTTEDEIDETIRAFARILARNPALRVS